MEHITREGFDLIMKSGEKLLLYFYREGDAASFLGMNTMKEIEQLLGRDFNIYLVNVDLEPEISYAFANTIAPEFITMKDCKIHKRSTDRLTASQVLELLK